MQLQLLKSKIHRARVTACDLEYEGSLAIDLDLMEAAGIVPYEKILVVNAANGERLETYAIAGERGSRMFCLNGAAARKGMVNDLLTIMSFAIVDAAVASQLTPAIIVLNEKNEISLKK